MKKISIILLLLFALNSCKEEVSEQLRVLIKNETSSMLTIKLVSKSKYMTGHMYDYTEEGGGYKHSEFELEMDSEDILYVSVDLNKKPTVLMSEIFDSIYVVSSTEIKTQIIFTPDSVIGYSENLYKEDSLWRYELIKEEMPSSFQRNPVEYHDYTFTISDDKY